MSALKDIISGIELDAAWKRVKDLEDERDRALYRVEYLRAERDRLVKRNTDLIYEIRALVRSYTPDTPKMADLLGELNQLWTGTSRR